MKIKYYQEKKYLNGDLEAIELLNKKRLAYIYEAKDERKKYQKELYYYNQYISLIAELLIDLGLNNSLEYSQALTYLIKKGYLSINHTFKSQEAKNELISCWGMNIIEGLGCCRNFGSFHNDVMKALNEDSRRLYCYLEGFIKVGKFKSANHMINEITYEGRKYGIDIYHNKLFRYKNPFSLKEISLYDNISLTNKPYYEIIYNEKSLDEVKEELKLLEEESKKKTIPKIVYSEELKYKTFKYLEEKQEILEDFHNKTKIIRKEITNKSNTR